MVHCNVEYFGNSLYIKYHIIYGVNGWMDQYKILKTYYRTCYSKYKNDLKYWKNNIFEYIPEICCYSFLVEFFYTESNSNSN